MPLDGVGDLQESDPVLFSVLACAREAFPVMPIFLANDGSVQQEGGILEAGHRPIDTAQDSETRPQKGSRRMRFRLKRAQGRNVEI